VTDFQLTGLSALKSYRKPGKALSHLLKFDARDKTHLGLGAEFSLLEFLLGNERR
jgi:hypothetical protein